MKQSDRPVTLGFETAQRLFDALVGSMDFGSGFLESDDVEALRELAAAIGVDPDKGTPNEFKAQYPHAFVPETDPDRIAWQVGALTQTVAYDAWGSPQTVNTRDEAAMPPHPICKVGPYGGWCGKPADHEIHKSASEQSREMPALRNRPEAGDLHA